MAQLNLDQLKVVMKPRKSSKKMTKYMPELFKSKNGRYTDRFASAQQRKMEFHDSFDTRNFKNGFCVQTTKHMKSQSVLSRTGVLPYSSEGKTQV